MKIKLGLGKMSMRDVARYCGGELYDYTNGQCDAAYVCTDSREADEQTLFVATRGERVDGHDYIVSALDKGCKCVLCEYVPTDIGGRCAAFVTVENSMDAFADIARGYRENNPLKCVAITGSVGKTTTKELTAAILKKDFETYATEGNFNSVIGMPMSLMEVAENKERAVFEMGMSGFGEISSMTRVARPDVAMVVNVGSSHLEYLKTRENIARAKLEIREGLKTGGYLLLNGDEPLLESHVADGDYNVLLVGIKNRDKCDIYAENITVSESGTRFDLVVNGKKYSSLELKLVGTQFVYNASFAASAALLLGCSENAVREGLYSYTPSGIRQNIYTKNGVSVIADCYNAAPESVRAAIDTLCSINVKGRRIAVLGDMKELGEGSDEMHEGIGRYVYEKGVDLLFTFGSLAKLIAKSAESLGMPSENIASVTDPTDHKALSDLIKEKLLPDDAILFKASRSMALEKVIEGIF